MIAPMRKCPKCGMGIKALYIMVSGPFRCPFCDVKLQAAETYMYVAFWVWMPLAVILLYVCGFRELQLILLVLLSLLFEIFFVANILKFIIPPTIQVYLPHDTTLRLRE